MVVSIPLSPHPKDFCQLTQMMLVDIFVNNLIVDNGNLLTITKLFDICALTHVHTLTKHTWLIHCPLATGVAICAHKHVWLLLLYTHTHAMHTRMRTHAHAYTSHAHAYAYAYMSHAHTYTHAQCTHTHAHMHIHTHTCLALQIHFRLCPW